MKRFWSDEGRGTAGGWDFVFSMEVLKGKNWQWPMDLKLSFPQGMV